MANTKSAEKRNRQNASRRERNRSKKSTMRTAIKRVRTAVAAEDAENAREALARAVSIIDATAAKGVIHPNAAARYKSRLTRHVNDLAS